MVRFRTTSMSGVWTGSRGESMERIAGDGGYGMQGAGAQPSLDSCIEKFRQNTG